MSMDEAKVYFSIAEVQEQTGLPASTLRYWESKYAELSPRKDGHGNRYYTQKDINIILQIKYLRDEMHITHVEAIRRELQHGTRQTDVKQRATEILRRVRQELVEIKSMI